ncbi:GAF domain-containing protein, partial [Azotobacter beijerinckii]|uniref:GAF domain-containing protein n=1 Tax=Azotobacter beijerinckii TaxID=170623 RepID=UPI00295465FB
MQANRMLRHAQQVRTLAEGRAIGPANDPSIARSWLRCLEQHQLDPSLPLTPSVLEHAHMLQRRERLQQVLEIASGEMNSLHLQLAGSAHAVLLTDARGVILNRVSAAAEQSTFEHAGLWLGADWSEACEGTNGIGTCLVERQPLTIQQEEHFRSCHTGLTCSASPVFDPHGELLAVLDVSSLQGNVSRQSQFHTMALVNLSAKVIESCYFLRRFEGEWLLRFHLQAEYVGLFSEGLLAFDGEGRVLAVNQTAINLLGGGRRELLGQSVEALFASRLDDLLALASEQPSASWPLRTQDGRLLFALLLGLLALPFGEFALGLMQPSAALDALTREYFHTRLLGLPAVLAGYALIGWLLGTQNARAPLAMLLVTSLVNVALNLWFVLGLDWGVAGAARASVLAEWSGALLGLVL